MFFVADQAQGAERAAVKRVLGRDELRAAPCRPVRELDHAFHRLRTRS